VSKLDEIAPSFDASVLLRTGVIDLTQNVPLSLHSAVQESYNSVLAHVWYVSVALSAISIIAAFLSSCGEFSLGQGLVLCMVEYYSDISEAILSTSYLHLPCSILVGT
jgi:hypothetical protein